MDAGVKTKTAAAKPMSKVIRKIGIIGAGQMGNGIAHVIALSGYDVAVNDLKKEAFDKALSSIQRNMVVFPVPTSPVTTIKPLPFSIP